jgi:hypothetical protein
MNRRDVLSGFMTLPLVGSLSREASAHVLPERMVKQLPPDHSADDALVAFHVTDKDFEQTYLGHDAPMSSGLVDKFQRALAPFGGHRLIPTGRLAVHFWAMPGDSLENRTQALFGTAEPWLMPHEMVMSAKEVFQGRWVMVYRAFSILRHEGRRAGARPPVDQPTHVSVRLLSPSTFLSPSTWVE